MLGYATAPTPRRKATSDEAYRRRRSKREFAALPPAEQLRVDHLASRERLYHAGVTIQRQRPESAGPDGVSPEQLSKSEVAQLAGEFSAQVIAGSYRPSPKRTVKIPKPAGGHRTLRIANFGDKIVARALYDAVAPHVDSLFVDDSHGFRPRRGVWTLLARLKLIVEQQSLWTLVVKDVQKAFDTVRVEKALSAHRALLAQAALPGYDEEIATSLLRLVEMVLRGGNPKREVGIDTGCPYSPLALNILLHMKHDLFLAGETTKPLLLQSRDAFRYADNIVVAVKSVHEGEKVIESMGRNLLSCDLTLKDDGGVFALGDTGEPELLGYTPVRRHAKMEFMLHPNTLQRLEDHLLRTYAESDPQRAAHEAVLGWASSVGPAFDHGRALLPQVSAVLLRCGFREAPSQDALTDRLQTSYEQWLGLLQRTRHQLQGV
jgi:RNA-directed DNA polymerase